MPGCFDVPQVLPHGVGGALVPAGVVQRLLGGEDFHEAAVEGVEDVGAADVLVQAGGVELREDVDAVQAAVDAVGDGDVDEAVLARHRHGRLGADLGEGIEPGALSAAEYESDYVSHGLLLLSFARRPRWRAEHDAVRSPPAPGPSTN